jgi:NADH dehydrogenase
VDAGGAMIAGKRVAAGTVVWAAGVQASPAGRWLGVPVDRAGRVPVEPDLSVAGVPGVFVLGDTASTRGADGVPLAALAQVAAQQGEHLGGALAAHLRDATPIPPFRFRNRGNTAIIGRNAAVFDFGSWRLKGRFAWLLWALVHVYLLVGFDNRLRVCVQWFWHYLTHERGARLIMSESETAAGAAAERK